jgi:hypothetical protein
MKSRFGMKKCIATLQKIVDAMKPDIGSNFQRKTRIEKRVPVSPKMMGEAVRGYQLLDLNDRRLVAAIFIRSDL